MEAKVEEAAHRKNISEKDIEAGLLVKIIYKGLFYMDMELHAQPDESTIKCNAPLHLIHKHRCISNSTSSIGQNSINEITDEEEIKHIDEEQQHNKEREQKKEKDRTRGKDRKKDERMRDRKRIKERDREMEIELIRNNANQAISGASSYNIIELKGHNEDVFLCAWNPKDTNVLATCGSDGTLRIWNISNWQKNNTQPTLIKHLFNKSSESVCCLDWNPTEANTIAIAYSDGLFCIYNSKGALRSSSRQNSVLTIKWSPKGEHLLTVTQDGFSICTDKRGNTVGQYKHESYDESFVASTKNNILVYTINQENPIKTLTGHKGPVKCLAYDNSKTYLASGSSDSTVKIWKENKKEIGSLNHESEVHGLAWSNLKTTSKKKETGYILATATKDHKVTIWDTENGKKLKELKNNQAIVSTLEFSPNGAFLALGSYDQTLLIIDAKSFETKISYRTDSPIYRLHWDTLSSKIAFSLANGNVSKILSRYLLYYKS
ncbi:10232_t:CDS:10 [Funneliformis geosporum]|uniref:14074_t:CDS:1 n=1 Tax=Funneliformis geosporum TaxID=1117311 RepID=A0A9W4SDC6_9GLOM|nr:14074_t:CDS:10 [Funneliformis geosporum]CAI2172981.1 10232_t:CDS:10 [Funneliformis geosporum]